jgi:hypothetical protein
MSQKFSANLPVQASQFVYAIGELMRTLCTARLIAPLAFVLVTMTACGDTTSSGGNGTPTGSGGSGGNATPTGSGGNAAPTGSGGNAAPTGSGGTIGGGGATGGGGSIGPSGSGGTAPDAGPASDGSAMDAPPKGPVTPGVLPSFPGTKANYGNGYFKFNFPANGHTITVYAPPKPRDGLPWVWHGEFPDVIPNTNNAWLANGLMIVYVNGASEQYGCPDVVKVWEAAYTTLVGTYHMAPKMVITGISRGGLYAYNFAATHPDQVAGVYADNGTCDFRSWPGGRQLNDPRWQGPGGGGAWQTVINVYHFKDTAEAIAYQFNPIDNLAPLAKAGVKLFHVTAQMDSALPWKENTGIIMDRYPKMGGDFQVIFKPNADHHPHGLEPDPSPVVNWTVATLASANGLAP